MTAYENLEIFAKSTKQYELTFEENGVAIDLTGWTVYFYVKENMQDTDANAKIKKTITSHSNATLGETLIELSSSDTDLLGSYSYEISYLDDDGNQDVLLFGKINFRKPVLLARS